MSTLTFTLRQAVSQAIDLSALLPSRMARLSQREIERLALGEGENAPAVGDLFRVSGERSDTLAIAGSSPNFDYAGAGLDGGTIVIEGSTGNYAGSAMKTGRLDIRGDAGAYLASRLTGGLVTVKGSAGDFLGGARPGDRFGMQGGIVTVEGSVGERAGDRMRRGTVVVRGMFGASAGSRMIGGTLWTEKGFGPGPGPLLRRGTLIGPAVERMLPTFSDCGRHDLVILRILSRYIGEELGPLAPKPLPAIVRRYAGDLATLGKGEILLRA